MDEQPEAVGEEPVTAVAEALNHQGPPELHLVRRVHERSYIGRRDVRQDGLVAGRDDQASWEDPAQLAHLLRHFGCSAAHQQGAAIPAE